MVVYDSGSYIAQLLRGMQEIACIDLWEASAPNWEGKQLQPPVLDNPVSQKQAGNSIPA